MPCNVYFLKVGHSDLGMVGTPLRSTELLGQPEEHELHFIHNGVAAHVDGL